MLEIAFSKEVIAKIMLIYIANKFNEKGVNFNNGIRTINYDP